MVVTKEKNKKKAHKAITRIGCKAFLKVTLDKATTKWFAISFKVENNHDLASPSELQFLRSHRQIFDFMLCQA